jgi:hypothetical protein
VGGLKTDLEIPLLLTLLCLFNYLGKSARSVAIPCWVGCILKYNHLRTQGRWSWINNNFADAEVMAITVADPEERS